MAHAEALRYHGSQSISQAAGKLPAVMLRASRISGRAHGDWMFSQTW